jgi:hypothetical protein
VSVGILSSHLANDAFVQHHLAATSCEQAHSIKPLMYGQLKCPGICSPVHQVVLLCWLNSTGLVLWLSGCSFFQKLLCIVAYLHRL